MPPTPSSGPGSPALSDQESNGEDELTIDKGDAVQDEKKDIKKGYWKCGYFVFVFFPFFLYKDLEKQLAVTISEPSGSILSILQSSNHLGNQSKFFCCCGPICYIVKNKMFFSCFCQFTVFFKYRLINKFEVFLVIIIIIISHSSQWGVGS